jgi:hypothetical protein
MSFELCPPSAGFLQNVREKHILSAQDEDQIARNGNTKPLMILGRVFR